MSDHANPIESAPVRPALPRLWFQSLRAPTLLTSILPAAAGGLAALDSPHPDWWLFPVALLALLFVHAGTNISNDVEDAARGVDSPDKVRSSRVFNTGLLTITHGRRLYAVCFALAFALGVTICLIQGPALIVIGVIGIAGGLGYTAGPAPYKYVGLGEPLIVLLMGPLMTLGTYTAVTGALWSSRGFWVGMGPGLLIAGVLAANNLDDWEEDGAAGVRTLAVRIGFDHARWLYALLMLAVIPAQLALWVGGAFDAWILLPLALAPVLLARAREALAVRDPRDPFLATFTPRTAQVHLAFAALLCAAVVLART
jgi:1,4-dihydroxy-2-naphthoate octaprenyltransferase